MEEEILNLEKEPVIESLPRETWESKLAYLREQKQVSADWFDKQILEIEELLK